MFSSVDQGPLLSRRVGEIPLEKILEGRNGLDLPGSDTLTLPCKGPSNVPGCCSYSGGRKPGDISPSRSMRRLLKRPGRRSLGGRNSSSGGKVTYLLGCGVALGGGLSALLSSSTRFSAATQESAAAF
jgi:hypothetical protein